MNSGTRPGLIRSLNEMRTYLEDDEQALKVLTDSTINRLNAMSDAEFAELDLEPDFLMNKAAIQSGLLVI